MPRTPLLPSACDRGKPDPRSAPVSLHSSGPAGTTEGRRTGDWVLAPPTSLRRALEVGRILPTAPRAAYDPVDSACLLLSPWFALREPGFIYTLVRCRRQREILLQKTPSVLESIDVSGDSRIA